MHCGTRTSCLALVAGATNGIGREVALECASRGAKVVLGCRNAHLAEEVTAHVRHVTGNDDVFYVPVDLSSLSSVRKFVKDFTKQFGNVDILINNAG